MPSCLALGARGPGVQAVGPGEPLGGPHLDGKLADLLATLKFRYTLLVSSGEEPYQFLYAQALASLRRARSSMKLSNSLALKERTSYHVPSNDTTAARLSAPRLFAMREAA